jgi:urocanate hydratase
MYRFRPEYEIKARPIDQYPHRSKRLPIMLMISNNLDNSVAQHPHELITYGGNGAVFQNWAQYRITMKYLSEMTDEPDSGNLFRSPDGIISKPSAMHHG